MKIGYFLLFIVTNLFITYPIISLEDPSIQKKDAITKISDAWDGLAQESKQRVYEKARQFIYNLLPVDWTWNKIFKPIVEQTNQYYYDKTKNVGLWVAGAAAVGATTYGLYRWAIRRGMGGLVKDFQDGDKKNAAIINQLDTKIREFTSKNDNQELQQQDITLINGIKVLIASKISDFQGYIEQLAARMKQLNIFIQKDSSRPTTFQAMRSRLDSQPQYKNVPLRVKKQSEKDQS